MDIVFNASIIAAFFSGMVALFAPCCVTVLLPAYLGSVFRERKYILRMTFVFFAGIAVVLVPIGLGAAGLAQVFRDFHKEMYVVGGALMLAFAVLAILGKGMAIIPMGKRWTPRLNVAHAPSVFLLGIFSGAATSCCAPVLVGAVTLAVLTGTFWKALVVTFAYVFGMTFPLFLMAYLYDRFRIDQMRIVKGKLWQVRVLGDIMYVHSTNVLTALIFAIMGAILLTLGLSGNAFWSPTWQARIGEFMQYQSERLIAALMVVPNGLWGILIIIVFALLLWRSVRQK